MTSDRARISYDPSRAYRAVVAQQGRVTLEADVNESGMLLGEARRLEAIDVIGPAGTSDNGYEVTAGGAGGATIGVGSFWLGGWRLQLDKPVELADQPDWLDQPPIPFAQVDTVIALLVTEQEVSAVEDQALLEVALGGPDTGARSRLMQRFVVLDTGASDCVGSGQVVKKLLAGQGLGIDPASDQLVSTATLQVGFVLPATAPGPCDPPAQGGYLGADNQMICVTVVDYDPGTRTGTLAWGYNNASFLNRATVADAQTLKFIADPVDIDHSPAVGQAVEVLRAAADFGDDDYVAAPAGAMFTLTQAYASDTHTLALPSALDGSYLGDAPRPLFVRQWQALVPFTAGTAALLTPSGLTVTLELDALPSLPGSRPFWSFAVRPSTPQLVYPQRYLEGPQAPEGPRQWLCDLAVVSWNDGETTVLDDCRPTFNPLTEQTHERCCCAVVEPGDVAGGLGLQKLIDSLDGDRPSLSLRPGVYRLERPLVLRAGVNDGLSIQGCGPGVILTAGPSHSEIFSEGLIVVLGARDVSITGIEIQPALVVALPALIALLQRLEGASKPSEGMRAISTVALSAMATTDLTIEDCVFDLAIPPPEFAFLGVAVNVRGDTRGLTVNHNRFLRTVFDLDRKEEETVSFVRSAAVAQAKSTGPLGPWRIMLGIVMFAQTTDRTLSAYEVAGIDIAPLLDGLEVRDNLFDGYTLAVAVMSQLGLIRCSDNLVRDGAGGFYFLSTEVGASFELARLAAAGEEVAAPPPPLQFMYFMSEYGGAMQASDAAPPPAAAAPSPVSKGGEQLAARDFKRSARAMAASLQTVASAPTLAGAGAEDSIEAAAAEAPKPTAAAAKATAKATAAAASYTDTALKALLPMAGAARLSAQEVRPVLHIFDNDLDIRGSEIAASRTTGSDSGDGAARESGFTGAFQFISPAEWYSEPVSFDGVHVLLPERAGAGSVLVHDNRVRSTGLRSICARVDWPEEATVTGNVLVQASGERGIALVVLSDPKNACVSVAGNAVRGEAVIHAAKDPAPTSDWRSLNTVRI